MIDTLKRIKAALEPFAQQPALEGALAKLNTLIAQTDDPNAKCKHCGHTKHFHDPRGQCGGAWGREPVCRCSNFEAIIAKAEAGKPPLGFEEWWRTAGRFIDPDTSNVSWFDKREYLAEYAFRAGQQSQAKRIAELEAEVASYINGINTYENPLKAHIAELRAEVERLKQESLERLDIVLDQNATITRLKARELTPELRETLIEACRISRAATMRFEFADARKRLETMESTAPQPNP